jgi:hypothetical protein
MLSRSIDLERGGPAEAWGAAQQVCANFSVLIGFANRDPCTRSNPRSRTVKKSDQVSMPSAIVRDDDKPLKGGVVRKLLAQSPNCLGIGQNGRW